jgi:Putative tRNA binding domain
MQIIAGLRKHIEQQQLEGSLVVVILNLKTAKLAGEPSEGWAGFTALTMNATMRSCCLKSPCGSTLQASPDTLHLCEVVLVERMIRPATG